MTGLAGAVARTAAELSEVHVAALAAGYRAAGAYSPKGAALVRASMPAPHLDSVDRVNQAWAQATGVEGAAIALALEASCEARRARDHPYVQVVVTGPDSPAVPVRLTSEVVCQLIDSASKRVTLVSFAAYQMKSVIEALDAAVKRGVAISLILESPENLEGGGGADAYAKYGVYEWPVDHREPPGAKLHAKAVIVDGRDVLLTSANMTAAAYDKNIELGVLCRGGDVARQVQAHFDALIGSGVLERAK